MVAIESRDASGGRWGGAWSGEQVILGLYFKGDPKSYEMLLCHPTHIYCAHTMRIQKGDHVIPICKEVVFS